MKTYHLINSVNEVISKIKFHTKEEAIEYFSKMKNLEKKDLLKIYKIVKA